MKKYIKSLFNYCGYDICQLKKGNEVDNWNSLGYNIPYNDIKLEGNNIFLKKLDLHLELFCFSFILKAYDLLLELKTLVNASIDIDKNNKVYVNINNITHEVTSWEEILILNEIYVKGIYNLIFSKSADSVLVDIGMNVGFTSLFFAQKKEISKVYSYEPFPDTYRQALSNFKLNPIISSKITHFNYGLGNIDEKQIWDYNIEFKGSMGIQGLPNHLVLDSSKNQKIEVQIKNVSADITTIINHNETKKIFLKIDCEGAEYLIIKKLSADGILSNPNITCIMIEWHLKGPQSLLEYLVNNNYYVFSFNEFDKTIGMLYAVKK